MTRDQIYNLWAPSDSPWSLWAKPVLFAHLAPIAIPSPVIIEIRWQKQDDASTAVVVDMPGRLSVVMGLSLAAAGYRPVPLFNAVPGLPNPVIDVRAIATAIVDATIHLAEMNLPSSAPPAFLLDRDRRRGVPLEGNFDNRSISLPTDFPSAHVLCDRGITKVIVIQPALLDPQAELLHTLRRWQDAGIPIRIYSAETHEPPMPMLIKRPSLYKSLWHNLLVLAGLRRNLLGGFGGVLPAAGAG